VKNQIVKEISDLLAINSEKVRRWIRNGKLHTVQESRKDVNSLTEAGLNKFLTKTAKYISIATKRLAATAPAV